MIFAFAASAALVSYVQRVCTGTQGNELYMDANPLPWTQGFISGSNSVAQTVDISLMAGYPDPAGTGGTGRITLFTPNGTMLPHPQDPVQSVTQLRELFAGLRTAASD